VVAAIRPFVGEARAVKVADFVADASVIGISPRTIRQILSDADGVDFVIVYDDNGMYLADNAEDTEKTTRLLEARARSLAQRATRRRCYTEEHLPRRQMGLGL